MNDGVIVGRQPKKEPAPDLQLSLFPEYKVPEHCSDKNPMVRRYGPFKRPDQKGLPTVIRCKHCRILYTKEMRNGTRYFKCGKRGDSNGTGTDHRCNWSACSLCVLRLNTEGKLEDVTRCSL